MSNKNFRTPSLDEVGFVVRALVFTFNDPRSALVTIVAAFLSQVPVRPSEEQIINIIKDVTESVMPKLHEEMLEVKTAQRACPEGN